MKICKGCQISDCPKGYQICCVVCDEKEDCVKRYKSNPNDIKYDEYCYREVK
jgi:hypothetical protein